MNINRRHVLMGASSLALAGMISPAFAQPLSGEATILCGFPPGGTVDATARRLAALWTGKLAETVKVENRAGAAGRLPIMATKDAAADGRTILISPDSMMTIYPAIFRQLAYNPATDVTPVSSVGLLTFGLAIGPAVPESVKTLAAFVEWTKANPAQAQFASPAAGSMPHFFGDLFFRQAGVTANHVAYRGSAPAVQDLLAGKIPACFAVIGEFLAHRSTTGFRILAVTNETRWRHLPDVPTFNEQGFSRVQGDETFGVYLPKGAARPLVERINGLVREAAADAGTVESLARIGMIAQPASPEEFAARLERERAKWAPIVAASGFSLEA